MTVIDGLFSERDELDSDSDELSSVLDSSGVE